MNYCATTPLKVRNGTCSKSTLLVGCLFRKVEPPTIHIQSCPQSRSRRNAPGTGRRPLHGTRETRLSRPFIRTAFALKPQMSAGAVTVSWPPSAMPSKSSVDLRIYWLRCSCQVSISATYQSPQTRCARLLNLAAGEFVTPPIPLATDRPLVDGPETKRRFFVLSDARPI